MKCHEDYCLKFLKDQIEAQTTIYCGAVYNQNSECTKDIGKRTTNYYLSVTSMFISYCRNSNLTDKLSIGGLGVFQLLQLA